MSQPIQVVHTQFEPVLKNEFCVTYMVLTGQSEGLMLFVTFSFIFDGCWSFTSWQHHMSYQDGNRVVIIYTHGDFIVFPH